MIDFSTVKVEWDGTPPQNKDDIEDIVKKDCQRWLGEIEELDSFFHTVFLDDSKDRYQGPQIFVFPNDTRDGLLLKYDQKPEYIELEPLTSGPFAGKTIVVPKV